METYEEKTAKLKAALELWKKAACAEIMKNVYEIENEIEQHDMMRRHKKGTVMMQKVEFYTYPKVIEALEAHHVCGNVEESINAALFEFMKKAVKEIDPGIKGVDGVRDISTLADLLLVKIEGPQKKPPRSSFGD